MASEEKQPRNIAIDRAIKAAGLILAEPRVRNALGSESTDTLKATLDSFYAIDVRNGEAITPKDKTNTTSLAIVALGSHEVVRFDRNMSTLHELQIPELSAIAVANGYEDGPLIDKARLALDEAFKNDPQVLRLSVDNQVEQTVAAQTELQIEANSYRLRGRPAVALRLGGYDKAWSDGLSLVSQILAANQILGEPLTLSSDIDDETKETEQQVTGLYNTIAIESVGLLHKDVFDHHHPSY